MSELKRHNSLEIWCWGKFRSWQAQASRFRKLLGRLTRPIAKAKNRRQPLWRLTGSGLPRTALPTKSPLHVEPYRVSFLLQQQIPTTRGMCCLYRGMSRAKPIGFTEDSSFGHTLPEYTKIPGSFYQEHSLYSSVGTDGLSLVFWKDGGKPSPIPCLQTPALGQSCKASSKADSLCYINPARKVRGVAKSCLVS